MSDVDRFLERFFAFGDRPGVETYLPLFHPEATLCDAGMERPIRVPEIPEHIEGILKQVPDFRMVPERWRHRDGTLFVEARNRATVGVTPARWRSVYCVSLEGEQVIRGRRYYDRRALFALLNPALPALPEYAPVAADAPPVAEPAADPEVLVRGLRPALLGADPEALPLLFREDGTLSTPGASRPLARHELAGYQRALGELLGSPRAEPLSFACDGDLGFAEWQVTAQVAGAPLRFGVVDRIDLAGGRILAARAYFDTLELATRLAEDGR